MEKKKLKLSTPVIQSFVTTISKEDKATIAGGIKYLKPKTGITIYTCLSGCNVDCEPQTSFTIG